MTTLRRTKRPLLLLAAIACVPLACKDGGCGGGTSGGAPSATTSVASPVVSSAPVASTSASASGSAGRPRGLAMRASGATGALFRAAHGLELKDEQKTALEKIATELREVDKARGGEGDGGGPRSAMKEAHDDMVAAVKAGKIDAAKMDAHVQAMDKTTKAHLEREAEALNKLHAALDESQRKAAVAAVRAAEEKRAAKAMPREKPDGGRPNFARARLENMTKDLDLDAEQQKKVQAILPKDDPKAVDPREEAKKHSDQVLAGFEKDPFDAKKVPEPKKMSGGIADMVKFLGQLLPILKPEQREKLATKLEPGDKGGHGRMRAEGRPHDMYPDEEDDSE